MAEHSISRRSFIQSTAAGAASLSIGTASARRLHAGVSPNERLRIGFIGLGNQCQTHLESAFSLHKTAQNVEFATVCDVFNKRRDGVANRIKQTVGAEPKSTGDYREIIDDPSIDAVCIATPDHWHAKITIEALLAGKHVYCEKPMTHTVEEAINVLKVWRKSGKVMQVGVQSTSLPVWLEANRRIRAGMLGKVLQYQTELFRNSDVGQWRYYELTREMTPANIDWKMFLGTEFGLAPDLPFDRALFGQWRCYWPFGSGMFTDLFVHRTTTMLLATGLRFPARIVGAGGIFLEYDGRGVPDVATVVADFAEGVQGIVTATMCSANTPIQQLIRGHFGSVVFGNGEEFSGFDFVAERREVTHDKSIVDERVEVGKVDDVPLAHFTNFVEAALAGRPDAVNCSPELGAAALVIVKLGAKSYLEGKVFHVDASTITVSNGDDSWSQGWQRKSEAREKPRHVAGWHAGDKGSLLTPKPWQTLAGPWINGIDPAS